MKRPPHLNPLLAGERKLEVPSPRWGEGGGGEGDLQIKKEGLPMFKKVFVIGFLMFGMAGTTFAAHPLITDDAGTQGKGKSQLEFIVEYSHDEEDGVAEKSLEIPTIPFLSYGITDAIDVVLGITYSSVNMEDAGTTATVRGVTDTSIELKWRFYEKDGLSFAVKPGISLPTGDENNGLGNGNVSFSTFFIATKEAGPWAFHLNLGHAQNEYKLQEDKDANRAGIWHASIASQVEVANDLTAVANVGIERNPDKTSNTHPAFILGGLIYSIAENVDLDFGIKGGLNKPETDLTVLAGIALKF